MKKVISKIQKLGPRIFFKKLIGYDAIWACSFRYNPKKPLYKGGIAEAFTIIPNTKEYWYADPLFYTYENRTFLFMEGFNYRKNKGEIVCTEMIDGKPQQISPVIEEAYHLSFPNIFEFQGKLLMIPECEVSGGINIYACKKFPDQWELLQHIKTPLPLVDCTIEKITGDEIQFISSTFDGENQLLTKWYYFQLTVNKDFRFDFQDVTERNNLEKFTYQSRSAGRYVSVSGGKQIKCVQKSKPNFYGYSVIFDTVRLDDGDTISTTEIKPSVIKLKNSSHLRMEGIHTYSRTKEYEAIDIGYFKWNFLNLKNLWGKYGKKNS